MLTIPHPAIHDYSAEWIYQENRRLHPQNKSISASRYALAIGIFDLRDATETLHTGRRGREIPLCQIIALRCALIACCQTMLTLFSRQQSVSLHNR